MKEQVAKLLLSFSKIMFAGVILSLFIDSDTVTTSMQIIGAGLFILLAVVGFFILNAAKVDSGNKKYEEKFI